MKNTHIIFTDDDLQAIAKVKEIMRRKGFPASTLNTTEAVRFALLDCIACNRKKVAK